MRKDGQERGYSNAGVKNIFVRDSSIVDNSFLLSDAFKYSHLIVLSSSYNAGVFPKIEEFMLSLKAHNYQNRKVAFTGESNSERFAATFNEDQRDAQNFPKMEISIDSFRVRIKVNNGYFKVNQELTKELQKIMQQEWKYYYIYLAYNIIMRAKNATDPVDKNTLEEYFRDAGLKYNGDLAEVKYHLSSFRPELVECYVDFYEKPDEENE